MRQVRGRDGSDEHRLNGRRGHVGEIGWHAWSIGHGRVVVIVVGAPSVTRVAQVSGIAGEVLAVVGGQVVGLARTGYIRQRV